MKPGSIILTNVTQADGKTKLRPALILCKLPPYNDFFVCGISSQLHQAVTDFDEIINEKDSDYKSSGLTTSSLIRLGFLAVLPQKNIVGSIGSVSKNRHKKLLDNLAKHILKEAENK